MIRFKSRLKRILQLTTGYWVHLTRTLPRGTDMTIDVNRIVDRKSVSVVFDVGANVGQSIDVFLIAFPNATVHAFEPVSKNYVTLRHRYESNPRVIVNCVGLSDSARVAEIHVNPDVTECSLEFSYGDSVRETIVLDTIDAYCAKASVTQIDFLKIDVEGHELNVLHGARETLSRNSISFLFLETELIRSDRHFVSVQEYAELLGTFGYSLVGIYDQMREWDGNHRLQFANVLFGSNALLHPL